MPGPCIMPGPMASMCFCIRSMWPTIPSHISTLVCQRPFSAGSSIAATLACRTFAEKIAFQSSVRGRFLANDRGYPEAEANR